RECVGAAQATGGVLQVGEPSMDGVRHEQRLPHGIMDRGLAVYRDSAVSAGNVTRMGRRGVEVLMNAERARVSRRLPIALLYAPPLRHVTSCCINRFQVGVPGVIAG